MNEFFEKMTEGENSVARFNECVRRGIPSAVFGISDPFKHFLVAAAEYKVLFVAKDALSAAKAAEAIREFSGKKTTVIPPNDETLVMARAFSKESAYKRIAAISEISSSDVIIVTPEAAMQLYPKKIRSLVIEKGKEYFRDQVISNLIEMGYTRAETASSPGFFSVRGDVLDVFAINLNDPVRIDFFGDEAESIKRFDAETRERIGFSDKAEILQAEEFVFGEKETEVFGAAIKEELRRAPASAKDRMKAVSDDVFFAIENRDNAALKTLCSLSENSCTLFDLLDGDVLAIIDEPKRAYEVACLAEREFTERFSSLYPAGEVFSFAKNNLMGVEKLVSSLKNYRLSAFQTLSAGVNFFNPLEIINPETSGVADYQLDFKEVFTDIRNWTATGYSVAVFAGDGKRAERFASELANNGIGYHIAPAAGKGVTVYPENLSRGFIFHEKKSVAIGCDNLFARPVSARKIRNKQKFFTAPEAGDYCVHEIHGIGRVLGSKKITTTEGTKDYVAVEYSGGDILYVPVEQMDILTRYLGGEKSPRLSKIGGKDFDKIKSAVKESIKKMSFDLKKLYAERNEVKGFAFTGDEELMNVFCGEFPFEETPDQAAADRDIAADMESGKVMDRLICGDVGFGKTEVAFRAVFRAVLCGKQAAMLAPTTILTEQHYGTAVERFGNFGVRIAVLNRFRTKAEQKKILEALKNGEIDFIIGTHRLLSADVKFKDLGLLVLDEEQRFGVEHKEKIKLLKKNVDALTLTATPIPRTLHMSLSGIRAISTINTPPKKRLPVQTYVTEETETLIRDAVSREVNRGGQAFILYNRVESIFSFAERIRAILPGIRITVAHGQMDERTLENNIISFYRHESDLLISTTIIENGIDLPRANTLIVIDADKLGLSTLYQLKGRVGRSDRLAYAYFTFKREKILGKNAFDRLNAIVEFAEMGSGIKIAMRDLEIRGAGNILGAEQHGHMDKIGYELYSKLLREELSGEEEIIPDLDVRVTAFIPDSYIASSASRMDAYKDIAEINSSAAEKQFREGIEDAYGKLPQEAENLVNIALVKAHAMKLGAVSIVVSKDEVSVSFSDFKIFAREKVKNAMDEFKGKVAISMTEKPKIEFLRKGESNSDMLRVMGKFLSSAADLDNF